MKLLKTLVLTTVAMMATYFLYAQSVTGKVSDSKTGEPVAEASILVRSTRAGTITNVDGSFSITAGSNDVLEISRIGTLTSVADNWYNHSLLPIPVQLQEQQAFLS